MNIYGPNDDDPDFFNKVIQMTNDIESHTLIVAGDFNVALDPVMDRFGIHNRDTKPKSREVILTWMEDMNMVDIWRLKNPSLRKYTYIRNRPHPHGSRIDYFLISSSLINLVKDISLGAKLLSDHKPNNLTITVTENNRGMGYFKLNTAHLKNPEYVRQINETIDRVISEYEIQLDSQQLWEFLKYKIRETTIKFSKIEKKGKKMKLHN